MNTSAYIPSLTPLRGIAAVLVVMLHYHTFMGPLATPDALLIKKFYLMVDLFFVLSGFVMYHVYGSWFEKTVDRKSFFRYMKARFARLYPLHLFLLLYLMVWASLLYAKIGYAQLNPIAQSILDPKAIPSSLLLVQAWGFHLEAPWNTPSWSISAEWFLYLLFPFLITFMVRYRQTARWVLGALACCTLLFLMFYVQPYFQQLWDTARQLPADMLGTRPAYTIDLITGPALLRGLCGFIAGMIAYELYQENWQKKLLQKGYWFLCIWIVLLGLWTKDWLPDVLAVGMFSLMILHTAYVEGPVKRLLNHRIFTYLGDISYSIYMVHMPIILTLFMIGMLINGIPQNQTALNPEVNYLNNWIGFLLFILIVIGLASLSYHYIEQPGRRWLKRRKAEPQALEQAALAE